MSTPVHPSVKLETGEDSPPVDRNSYQRLIGKSINLRDTRPDICFVVSLLSRFMHHPHEVHLQQLIGSRVTQWIPGQRIHFHEEVAVQ